MKLRIALSLLLTIACRPSSPPPTTTPTPTTTVEPTTPADPDTLYFAGAVAVPGMELAFAVELVRSKDGWTGKIQIPAQGARDLPLSSVVVDAKTIAFAIEQVGAKWSATRDAAGEPDECTFTQGPAKLECGLSRIDATRYAAMATPARPQTPKPPFDYDSTDVTYENAAAKVKLAGTLTVPKGEGPFPAVLMVTGSGAQDRDETIFGHRPFFVIADHFARHGIATLRVDDRGVGGSTGDPGKSTTEDFVGDALAGIAFLATQPKIDKARVGIIGHSEGGLIAPSAATRSKDVRFVVMLAGPGVPGSELLPKQIERVMKAAGAPDAEVQQSVAKQREVMKILVGEKDDAKAREQLLALFADEAKADPKEAEVQLAAVLSPWFRKFVALDPAPVLAKVKVPVLALVGELDVQVDAEQNATAITKALKKGKNKKADVRRMPGLNHLFQHAKTGGVEEYGTIEETIAPEVLDAMSTWISAR
ncbi:MAG TPA: alpha/beta fold hydrolase [Nannocystaceae bacterium]|nr:alpha/beta fold hydrolase [Nannocystaceae bacterium]